MSDRYGLTTDAVAYRCWHMSTIKYIRKEILKLKQADFAVIANATQASVSRWETGELSPDLTQLASIREAVLAGGHKWKDVWFFEAPKAAAE